MVFMHERACCGKSWTVGKSWPYQFKWYKTKLKYLAEHRIFCCCLFLFSFVFLIILLAGRTVGQLLATNLLWQWDSYWSFESLKHAFKSVLPAQYYGSKVKASGQANFPWVLFIFFSLLSVVILFVIFPIRKHFFPHFKSATKHGERLYQVHICHCMDLTVSFLYQRNVPIHI